MPAVGQQRLRRLRHCASALVGVGAARSSSGGPHMARCDWLGELEAGEPRAPCPHHTHLCHQSLSVTCTPSTLTGPHCTPGPTVRMAACTWKTSRPAQVTSTGWLGEKRRNPRSCLCGPSGVWSVLFTFRKGNSSLLSSECFLSVPE